MKKARKRLLSLLLAVVMVVSALPAMAVAAGETATYTKISSMDELTTGKYVMVVSTGYAPGVLDDTWVSAVQPVVDGDTVTDAAGGVWTLTVSESGVKLTDSNSVTVAPKPGNNNGIQKGDYDWAVACTDGKFTFKGVGTDSTTLASNSIANSGDNRFRAYKNTTVAGSAYYSEFTLYKLTDDGDTPTPSVAAPTANPAAGAVEAGTKVVLSAEEGATIYYTTDGTEPTTSSAAYAADGDSITINVALTIKAIAVKDGVSSPVATFVYTIQAAETETAEKMTAQPKDGDTVLIYNPANTAAMGSAAVGTKLAGVVATDNNGKLTISDEMAQLLVTVNEDEQYIFTLDGKYLTSGESGNSLSFADTLTDCGKWTLEQQTDGTWYIMNVGANYNGNYNQALEYYNGFTTYGVKDNESAYKMEFYLVSSAVIDPITDDMIGDGVLTVKQANESVATGVTVIGQVVYHYGKNYNGSASIDSIILEDVIDGEVYGFQVYDYTNYANYVVGDVVKVTGNIESYGGVMQMKSPTMEVVAAGKTPIPAQEITVSQMGADYLSEYVHISNVTLGTYSATGNTTVTDSTGTKNIYKGVPLPAGAAETDVIGVYGCCSAYNGTYQLRNGASTDYETNLVPGPDPVEPTIPDGDYVLYVPGYTKALSANYTGYYNSGVDMTLNSSGTFDGTIPASEVWTLTNNTDGTFTLTSKSENQKLGMAASNTSMPLGGVNDTWTVEATATDGLYYVKNVGRGAYIEWYEDKGNFSAYGQIASGSEKMFAIQFVPVTADQIETPVVTPGVLADGDYFIHSAKAEGVMRYVTAGGAGAVPVTIDGDKVVFTDGEGTGAGVYTITNIAGGKYTIQLGDLYLGENSKEELTLNETKDSSCEWIIAEAEGYDGYTIMNANVKYYSSNTYLEYYASRGFCMYTMKEMSDLYVFNFYDATGVDNNDGYVGERPGAGPLPANGTYVIYNDYASAVFGPQGGDDTARNMSVVGATLVEDNGETKVDADNGALIFTVETTADGDTTYYTFENDGKYLATDENDGENNAETLFLQENLTDYCYWTLEETEGGYVMYNKLAAYNGSRVCIEYFSGAFSGWTYKGGTNELFAFQFYPVTDTYGTGYVVNPKVVFSTNTSANQGLDFTVDFKLDDLGEVTGTTASVTFSNGTTNTYSVDMTGKEGTLTIPAADLVGSETLTVTVSATSKQTAMASTTYSGNKTYQILDLPVIVSVSPSPMSSVPSGTSPEIVVEYANAKENPTISLSLNGAAVNPTNVTDDKITYQTSGLADGKYTVAVKITRQDGKVVEKSWTFNVGTADVTLYFGQLHSHTAEYSDGAGTLADALAYVAGLPERENVDFVAFTDHSNYFDSSSAANPAEALYDESAMTSASATKWNTYKNTIAEFNKQHAGSLLALGGFEMTWSGGPGHINTWNTPGVVSRNNTGLNNKTDNQGMLQYFDINVTASSLQDTPVVSQFNHPGTTFGYFDSFAGWTAERDEIMTLIEVGNGEGSVGSTGYFPSYEYYDMALSKGWHVAPTNNQDNHKGNWGNANTCRSVILAEEFTEQGLYAAMAERRVYSTEDKNLSINYTLNDVLMGGIIEDFNGATVKIAVSLSDPDNSDTIGRVSVIGEDSRELYVFDTVNSNSAELECELENTSAYYYIRVVQGDKDIAVTAPVWVDEVAATKIGVKAGITSEGTAQQGEAYNLTVSLANTETESVTIKGYTVTVDGDVIASSTDSVIVAAGSNSSATVAWTPDAYGSHTVTVTYTVTMADGTELTVTESKDIYVKGTDYDKVVTIAEAKQGNENEEFTVIGVVTSNASGYDKETAFFDCIYIQDETGGINIFPVAGEFQVGQTVKVHGGITYYCGEIELNLGEAHGGMIEVVETDPALNPVAPAKVSCADAMADKNVGLLMQVSGKIAEIHKDSTGVIDRIYVDDGSGTLACIYINGYIKNSNTHDDLFSGDEIKVGATVTAIGIGSIDVDELAEEDGVYLHRLRVRDRAEIVCTAATTPVNPPVTPVNPVTPSKPSKPTAPAKDELPFVDVRSRDWFYEDVEFVYNEGIMNGTGKNRFSPDTELTRGMVVTILYRIENEPAAGKADMFGDVPSGQWYTKAVAWAADNGIVNGYPNGNFGPNDPITREQLAAILYRYTKFKGELVETKRDYLRGFADVDDISDYAVSAMNWAVGEGLIKGSNNKLLPKASATRAQVAAIIHRYLKR